MIIPTLTYADRKKFKITSVDKWSRWQIDLILILVTLIWGGTFLVVQNAIKSTDTFTFLTLRFGFGALTLAIIFWRRLLKITRAELLSGAFLGFFLFCGFSLQTLGLLYTTTSKAGFITGLNVVFVPVLAVLVLRQYPGWSAILGIIMATIGLTLLSLGNKLDFSFGLGEALVLCCAVSFAIHIVAINKLAPGKDAMNLATVQIGVAAVLSAIAVPIYGAPVVVPPGEVWLAALFMGIVATAFTFAVMNRVQQFTTSTRAALIYALEPVFAGIFGFVAGEILTIPALIGCGLIFSGMIISEIKIRWWGVKPPLY